jgi:hypothetical protein
MSFIALSLLAVVFVATARAAAAVGQVHCQTLMGRRSSDERWRFRRAGVVAGEIPDKFQTDLGR